jgi:hypothetical protein
MLTPRASPSCRKWPRPEPRDPTEDLGEQRSRHRHFGQLEHDVVPVAYDPGADLDQLLAHGGEPEGVIQLAVGEQAAVRGDLGAVEFELDPTVDPLDPRQAAPAFCPAPSALCFLVVMEESTCRQCQPKSAKFRSHLHARYGGEKFWTRRCARPR